jgi:diguanylate cyclase (GGDEF)-like protein/PAS domain S-box-containing protein
MPEIGTTKAALLLLLAFIAAFSAFLTAFRLAARGREGTIEGRAGWMFLASVAFGTGLWGGHALLYVADGSAPVFRSGLLLAGFFVALATALAGFTVMANLGRSMGPLYAGAVSAGGLAVLDAIGLSAMSTSDAISWNAPLAAVGCGVAAVLSGVGFAVGSGQITKEVDHAAAPGAALMAVAVLGSNSLFVGASDFVGTPVFAAGADGVGGQAVAAIVAAVMFLVVGSGMATALIDRDGQYASQKRLRQLAEASVEGIVVLADNKVVDVNDSFLRIANLSREDVRGMPFVGQMLIVDLSGDTLPHSMLWEGHLVAAHNRMVPVEVVARPFDYDGKPHTVFAIRDLSDRRDAELRIRFLADHDVLTGLPNRAYFQRELEERCAAGGRFALFCLDLDRFKEANDVFGHLAGDSVLVQAASRLRDIAGASVFAARLGGDEFVLIVPDAASPRALANLGDDIVTVLGRPFVYNDQRIVVGASVGIALSPGDGDTAELLLARADMALYRAKSQGRGGYCFFEQSMDEETRVRRQLAFELRDAIDENQLELYYQPLADLSSKGIVGFEALVRWHHPKHGTISPSIFISIAEESGFIAQLGEWVLRTACVEAGRWEKPLKIAVNLSALQLEQQTLPEIVHEVLLTSGLTPSRLELEVTESSLMRNPQRALDVLRRIKALGVHIAMDDFGTGFSSLSTLQSFPFDKLKIDRSFVDRVGTHGQAESIVRAVVGLSRSLDIRVVAEGVETQLQIEFLAEEDCDEVQGFMIGRPLPIAAYRDVVGTVGTLGDAALRRARQVG